MQSVDSSPTPAVDSPTSLAARLRRANRRTLNVPDDWGFLDSLTGSRSRSERILEESVRSGAILRISRGHYLLRSPSGAIPEGALDIVGQITRQRHLVTAGAALADAGWLDQGQRVIIVLVGSDQRPWTLLGQRITYLRVIPGDLWGGRPQKLGGPQPTIVARPERAILDAAAHPGWGVTLSQVARATRIGLARDPQFHQRLAAAAARYGNTFLARRLGMIVQTLSDSATAAPFLPLRGASRKVIPLDRTAEVEPLNRVDWTWRVAMNVDLSILLEQA